MRNCVQENSMKEQMIITLLYCLDFIMNLITLGKWGRVRGAQRIFRVKE